MTPEGAPNIDACPRWLIIEEDPPKKFGAQQAKDCEVHNPFGWSYLVGTIVFCWLFVFVASFYIANISRNLFIVLCEFRRSSKSL